MKKITHFNDYTDAIENLPVEEFPTDTLSPEAKKAHARIGKAYINNLINKDVNAGQ